MARLLACVSCSSGRRVLIQLTRLNSVYVCDEATASVDPSTDALVHDLLMSLPATVISICHRLDVRCLPRAVGAQPDAW